MQLAPRLRNGWEILDLNDRKYSTGLLCSHPAYVLIVKLHSHEELCKGVLGVPALPHGAPSERSLNTLLWLCYAAA